MSFKKLPENLKPREKAILFGFSFLNDIELFAIFLRTGSQKQDVLSLYKKIISIYQNFLNLKNTTLKDLFKIEGIGKAKAIEILALFEFSNRLNKISFKFINNQKEANKISFHFIGNKTKEYFLIIFLENNNQILNINKLYKGNKIEVLIDPKEIISLILKKDGKKIYIFHNHPSSNLNPSIFDIKVTKRLQYYCDLFGIEMISHTIINNKKQFLCI